MQEKPVEHLIVDSSVLIKQAPIKDLTNKAYIVSAAIDEIKDANTRHSLQVLPYDLVIKQPSTESIKYVSDFAKKTGDYTSLSAVDIQLIALAYEICKQHNDFRDLTKPDQSLESTQVKLDKPISIIGFYSPQSKNNNEKEEKGEEQNDKNEEEENGEEKNETENADINNNNGENVEQHKNDDKEENNDDNNNNDDDNDDDDDEGWISLSTLKNSLNGLDESVTSIVDQKLKVACMTADFSMQNVLLQMGISILSLDGLLLKKVRSYVLRCLSCHKITTIMEKVFCPKCGYKTLERIVEYIDAYGQKTYVERRKPKSTKGLRHALPMPRGGKHSNYPILSEDQPRPQNLPSKKAWAKTNPLDADYVCLSSPFAMRDVYSRSAHLGIKPNRHNMKPNKK